jgi:hypothetical protein
MIEAIYTKNRTVSLLTLFAGLKMAIAICNPANGALYNSLRELR